MLQKVMGEFWDKKISLKVKGKFYKTVVRRPITSIILVLGVQLERSNKKESGRKENVKVSMCV